MQEFKSKEKVLAEQYFKNSNIEGVLIGKNNPYDRFDDTPDGAYIKSGNYKYKLNEGDWIVKDENNNLSVMSDKNFKEKYKTI